MIEKFNRLLDRISEFLAQRKGLLPLIGIVLVLVNGILQFIPASGWVSDTNLLLHLGIIIAILGILLAWAL
jgi:hypothetical protein